MGYQTYIKDNGSVIFDRINRIDLISFSHFPEENEKEQSAFGRIMFSNK
jgi:hypothetical protein